MKNEPEPVKGTARLTLTVNVETQKKAVLTHYQLQLIPSHPEMGYPAWRLTKSDGSHYEVLLTQDGPICNCADYIYRREYSAEPMCKHLKSLRAVGLLSRDLVHATDDNGFPP